MMKVLTLRQPWASLVAYGIKKWETRAFKPGPANLRKIMEEGLYIHAGLSKKYSHLMAVRPFSMHLKELGVLPYGSIVCHVRIGKIIPTEQWLKDFSPLLACNTDAWRNEKAFGDYSPGRWAWEITDVIRLVAPIPSKGALSIWNHPNLPKQPFNGLAWATLQRCAAPRWKVYSGQKW